MERAVFTLLQVANSIKKTLKDRYHLTYWVKAEIYKLNLSQSGHAFPELVQREGGQILASMNGIIWKTNFDRIRRIFEQTVKEPFAEGKEMLMEIRIDYHEVYGLTLNLIDLDPSFSLGALHQLRLDTLKALSNLGILQKNQSLVLPLPKRIAVISAASSKGLSDFMNVLQRTKGVFGIETYLFNSQVQGNQGAKSMVVSLKSIAKIKDCFDAVVIVRGGGAEVGLSCYDDFQLCQEIANFPLPVLCGIGHSTNLTATEMVCHAYAITPSELANQIVAQFRQQADVLYAYGVKVHSISNHAIRHAQQTINFLRNALSPQTQTIIRFEKERVSNHSKGIHYFIPSVLRFSKQYFKVISKSLAEHGERQLQKGVLDIWKSHHQLLHQGKTSLMDQHRSMEWIEKQVQLMNPESVLSRGYAIVRANEKVLDDPLQVKPGQKIKIQFYKGSGTATMD